MVEMLMAVAVLAIVIMAWAKVDKALDWTGKRVGETTDMLSDLTVAGAKQTARVTVISHDSLAETVSQSKQKAVNLRRKETEFKSGLKEDEIADLKEHEAYLDGILKR